MCIKYLNFLVEVWVLMKKEGSVGLLECFKFRDLMGFIWLERNTLKTGEF